MISVAEERVRAQLVLRESLGETERKRSYRRDTVVLALPELAFRVGNSGWQPDLTKPSQVKEQGRPQIEATRNGARPCSFSGCYLQQARGTETGDRIGYLHWLPLKNPACHRNPQRRITQMPDFHKSLPTPDPYWGETTKVPS
jgi:hypothetical protein